jgi:predicted ATPase
MELREALRMADVLPRFFVITGGPGAGKTTLIEALARDGFTVSHEAGRRIIRQQEAAKGRTLPWVDRLAFAEAMLASDIAAYEALRGAPDPVFVDRGIPDVIGYLRLEGIAAPDVMRHAARTLRCQPRVFICPPWPEIYATDSERKQSLAVAERTYRAMVEVYSELGYALVDVPRARVDERVRFVRDVVNDATCR